MRGILREWKTRFEAGIPAKNYVGDIFGTLGGTPDFGPGASWVQKNPVSQFESLDVSKEVGRRGVGDGGAGVDVGTVRWRDVHRRFDQKGSSGADAATLAKRAQMGWL